MQDSEEVSRHHQTFYSEKNKKVDRPWPATKNLAHFVCVDDKTPAEALQKLSQVQERLRSDARDASQQSNDYKEDLLSSLPF